MIARVQALKELQTRPSPLFEDFCIIRPDGTRGYTNNYFFYAASVMEYTPQPLKAARKDFFNEAAKSEIGWEVRHELPQMHLMGLCEVYSDPIFGDCVARIEAQRLDLSDHTQSLPETPVEREHVILTITSSLRADGSRDVDITKQFTWENRTQCTCLLCLPSRPVKLSYSSLRSEMDDLKAIELLELNKKALEIYLPFRRRALRYHQGASPGVEGRLNRVV